MSAMFDQNIRLETVKEGEKSLNDDALPASGRKTIPLAIGAFESEPIPSIFIKP
jgi:hypothetical protein